MKILRITNAWNYNRAVEITHNATFCMAAENLGSCKDGFNIQNQIKNWSEMDVNNACNIALWCCELVQAGMLEVVEIEE